MYLSSNIIAYAIPLRDHLDIITAGTENFGQENTANTEDYDRQEYCNRTATYRNTADTKYYERL